MSKDLRVARTAPSSISVQSPSGRLKPIPFEESLASVRSAEEDIHAVSRHVDEGVEVLATSSNLPHQLSFNLKPCDRKNTLEQEVNNALRATGETLLDFLLRTYRLRFHR